MSDPLLTAEWASKEEKQAHYAEMLIHGGAWRKLGADGKLYHIPAESIRISAIERGQHRQRDSAEEDE